MVKGIIERPKLKLPYCPSNDEAVREFYDISTYEIKKISDYTKLNFHEVLDIPYIDMLIFLRDAFIYDMRKTKEGQEYLENCWMLEQTKIDRKTMREKFGKEA